MDLHVAVRFTIELQIGIDLKEWPKDEKAKRKVVEGKIMTYSRCRSKVLVVWMFGRKKEWC